MTRAVKAAGIDPDAVRAVKAATGVPTIAVGLITEAEQAEAIIGTGEQARLQAEAAHLARPFTRLMIAGRDPAKAAACATEPVAARWPRK